MFTEGTKTTITLTVEQRNRLEHLRSTTMADERSDNPKTLEEQIYQVIEKGLYAIEYNRKQYREKQLGKRVLRAMKDERFQEANGEALRSMMESLGITSKNGKTIQHITEDEVK